MQRGNKCMDTEHRCYLHAISDLVDKHAGAEGRTGEQERVVGCEGR